MLLIDKPLEWTSFDVVAKVRGIIRQWDSQIVGQSDSRIVAQSDSRILGQLKPQAIRPMDYQTIGLSDNKTPARKIKVGHTGTLDPLATGLMVVVVGSYCKRAQEFSKLDKTYEVTMHLGVTSTTGDDEGEKTAVSDEIPSRDQVASALRQFVGEIMQTPPIYSAMKINGQRAYKLAREGKEARLEPRPVTIHSIELKAYDYPSVSFTTHVSSGTYIRSLVEDIGKALQTGAYMSALRRTQVGPFTIDNAVQISEVTSGAIKLLQ